MLETTQMPETDFMKSCIRMPIREELLNFLCAHYKCDPQTAIFQADRKTQLGYLLLTAMEKETPDYVYEPCEKIEQYTASVRILLPKRRLLSEKKVARINDAIYGFMIEVFAVIALSNPEWSMTAFQQRIMDLYGLDDLMTDYALTKALQRKKADISVTVFRKLAHLNKRKYTT